VLEESPPAGSSTPSSWRAPPSSTRRNSRNSRRGVHCFQGCRRLLARRVNRKLVGADAAVLARHAGASVAADTRCSSPRPTADHAFVVEEQMMPMMPVVRVKNIEQAIACAKQSEHGYKHSAIIHSLNVDHMTQMARALDTTLFVKNGPSVAGLGLGGEGYLSYSIATTTGEGITTPATFTRTRRCVMVDNLRIY
jgi:aldehyde dehydrogenase